MSTEQQLNALELANRVRFARSSCKRAVREGRLTVRQVLAELDPDLEGMRLRDLLLAIRWMGHAKVDRFLARHFISPTKRLGGLTDHQRLLVEEWLP